MNGQARHHGSLDPVLMMLAAMILAIALTWIIPSGEHQRTSDKENAPVIAGTYQPLAKPLGAALLLPGKAKEGEARPVSPVALATSIPAGLKKSAPLIFMILSLGGMFGVMRATGALDAGIQRLIGVSGGRMAILVPILMLAFSAGSTFLGMISEYLLLIPVMVALAERLGRSRMFGFAIVTLAAKVGYLASVTSPVALLIAQPIVNVPVFSGLGFRLAIWIVFLAIAMLYVLREARIVSSPAPIEHERLSSRHLAILLIAAATLVLLVVGSLEFGWHDGEFTALFIAAAAVMTLVARVPARKGVALFVDGMKSMMLAALLVGMGRAVEVILRDGQILDTIIEAVSSGIHGMSPVIVAPIVMGVEMILTLLIPSTSAKAALSIPVLGPIAASAGVSGQVTVLAFLFGNGLVNMLAPTSGMLLAYLAAAGIPYNQWFRFAAPLFALLALLSAAALMIAVLIGY
ncbi:YfcC family protein [Sphingomonas sp. MMSM20]|uniref:YfcC family protein n=1 Tax=Sphingomonas lycopersici TaxID=2951807 RepID=UPI002237DFEC|nr:YfcC family protein [Sphingomonas lycopersici]MCW6530155.1 YfcC family protein [Sphingomonas lycopersici]